MMQVPAEFTVNQNAAECIRTVSYIGHTTYHNICARTQIDVPWGSMDWVMNVGGVGLSAAFSFTLVVVMAVMLREVWQ